MGLITKTVKTTWNNSNKKHYVELGYIFTKIKDELEVKVEHLTKGSHVEVECICDNCGCELTWGYCEYIKCVKKDGKTYCKKCSNILYDKKKATKTRLKNSKSFEEWCMERDRVDIIRRWDYELNNCKPSDICYSSNKKYWFKCDKNPKHKSELKNIDGFTTQGCEGSMMCKQCNSFAQWCISNNRQDVLNRWDYELNSFTPWEVDYSSNKKYWFKCDKHSEHKSELKSIDRFVHGQNGSIECNQCNSIAQWMIDHNLKLEDYWDYNKNTISPWNISYSCTTKVWIKCQEKDYHGSYKRSCNEIVWNKGCPYCNPNSGKVHPQDSLGQYIIDNFGEDFLNKVWSDKNKKSPFEYTSQSMKEVWWKCLDNKHEDYKRSCNLSYRYNFRCPQCSNERIESLGEEQVRLYLKELGYITLHEHNCTIRPINPKTKQPLPYDNEIILDNGEHLIIEVHGDQHYDCRFYRVINKCSQEEAEQHLYKRKLYDRYKRIYAIQHGYYYLEIPYKKIFGKQETYKKLIDDKINEIKQIKNNQQEESA